LLDTISPEAQGTRHGVYDNTWFGSVKNANEVATQNQEYAFQVQRMDHISLHFFWVEDLLYDGQYEAKIC
jgi:hypothetical protein